jgi:hypothetical protein
MTPLTEGSRISPKCLLCAVRSEVWAGRAGRGRAGDGVGGARGAMLGGEAGRRAEGDSGWR